MTTVEKDGAPICEGPGNGHVALKYLRIKERHELSANTVAVYQL